MQPRKKKLQKGFTLIELLIVIGLLGALTSLILPSLSASRRDAIMDTFKYNKAGTFRALKQHQQMIGKYPDNLHTGYTDAAGTDPMPGLPMGGGKNLAGERPSQITPPNQVYKRALTATEAASLKAAGITHVSHGAGSTAVDDASPPVVAMNVDRWRSHPSEGASAAYIDGRKIGEWEGRANPDAPVTTGGNAGPYTVIPLRVTPDVIWAAGEDSSNDWAKGNFEVKIEIEGQANMASKAYGGAGVDPDFGYINAFFLVHNDSGASETEPARLIGVGGPSGTVLNQ